MNETQYPNRRRPWTAVFLSLVMPGLGQIYCGDIKSGMVVTSVVSLFSLAWVVGILRQETLVFSFSVAIGAIILLASVFAAIDAYRRACRTRYDYKLKDYNHWAIYLMLFWCAGLGTIECTILFRKSMASSFVIRGNSMAPTIMGGDRTIADKMVYDKTEPRRGDIVLFKNPKNLKQNFIKRIVALGGDTVEYKNGQLLINGQPLERQWLKTMTIPDNENQLGDVFYEINNGTRYQVLIAKSSPPADFGPVTVPPYQCFLMGDNRNDGVDSRQFGTLSTGAIRGKFQYIYWRNWLQFGEIE